MRVKTRARVFTGCVTSGFSQVCLGRRKAEDELVGLTQAIYFLETLCLSLGFAHKPFREFCTSWLPNTHSGVAGGAAAVTQGGFVFEGGELL